MAQGAARRYAGGFCLAWLMALASGAMAAPVSYRVDEQASYFAVITHADGFGHDHLVTAIDYRVELAADDQDLTTATFTLSAPVEGLNVDAPEDRAVLEPRLRALGVVEDAFPDLSARDRATVDARIRSETQLDAARHPILTARVIGVSSAPAEWDDHTFPQQLDIALTVRGTTVVRRVPATIVATPDRVRANALGRFRFTEFGIEPFRAALGLLRNADMFHVYVDLQAKRVADAHSLGRYPVAAHVPSGF